MDRFLVIDKPPGVTSHDVVAVVRAVTGLKKVGHTGTLDPFATGVLPLALGGATRLIQYLDESIKIYDATVQLGAATDTGDPTGQVIAEAPVNLPSRRELQVVLDGFMGERMQRPPRYSAVKIQGKPMYAYAREGKPMEAAPRPIRIDRMELLDVSGTTLRVLIHCSRGTYARVLAEEIGQALGTVGHLSALRRTRSGPFLEEHALSFSQLSELVGGNPAWNQVLRPARGENRVPWRSREEVLTGLAPWLTLPHTVLRHLPALTLSPVEARRYEQTGQTPARVPTDGRTWVLLMGEEVLGVCRPPAAPSGEMS